MSTFFAKPTGGPDIVGGVWPVSQKARCQNRSGATVSKGDVVMLDMSAVTTEIATNDENSYIPGASNDTIWNTIIAPSAAAITEGAIWGVCLESQIVDEGSGEVQFFGIVEEAFCISTGTLSPGQKLTITTAKNFDGVILSNEAKVAIYIAPQDTTISTRALKRVFLHNGLFSQGSDRIK